MPDEPSVRETTPDEAEPGPPRTEAAPGSSLELLRLAALRAPEPAAGRFPAIRLEGSSADMPRSRVARRRATEPEATEPEAPARGASLAAADLSETISLVDLDRFLVAAGDEVAPKDVRAWVKRETGTELKQLVSTEDFKTLRSNVHANLVQLLLPAPDDATPPADVPVEQGREAMLRGVRLLSLLEELARDDTELKTPASVRQFVRYATVILPDSFPRPVERLARPPAVADLKVVRLGPPRYEPGAIAHVENVLAKERRERRHRLLEQMETTETREAERSSETEEELGTTSQVELLQETTRAVEESTDLEAGFSVSAAYGPSVRVDADARVAHHAGREEVTRAAATFSNEITKRARERVVERTRESRVVRRLLETEETNLHGFDNTGGNNHIVGVYRWVESVQDAWIENYGKRLMLEFLVPEPAAFVRWATAQGQDSPDIGPPPEEPKNATGQPLGPDDIDTANYLDLIAVHRATTAPPPPAESLELGVAFKGEKENADLHVFTDQASLKVPGGYAATSWEAHCVTWGQGSPDGEVWMAGVGANGVPKYDNTGALQKRLDGTLDAGEGSVIPVVMLGRGLINLAASVRIHCALTEAGRARWRLAVYEAIMRAYEERLEEWELQKARAEADAVGAADDPLEGSANPLENRAVERRELRRSVIHMLLGYPQDARIFAGDAVVYGDGTVRPELALDVAAAERDPIAFFEQAFEWGNMTWVYYPYYWANAERWADDCRRTGSDPTWAAFLSAGAARVVAPVRPGFENAIALYLGTGIIWNGGQVPTIGDEAYVSIAEEVAEALGTGRVASERVPLDPVRLPTSLVWLQPTGDLNPA